jgi:membrane-bound lytic murein transglycosylase D
LIYHKQIEPGDVLYLKPKKRKASIESHKVGEGETMWEISQKYAIKINSLYKKNLMTPGTEPKAGVLLQLQSKAASRPDTGRSELKKEIENEYHTVGAGETLYSISRIYGLKVEELIAMNSISNNQIQPGQRLLVKKTQGTPTNSIKHTVQSGETLYSISKRYGVTVASIKSRNNLSSDSLTVGQILDIQQ